MDTPAALSSLRVRSLQGSAPSRPNVSSADLTQDIPGFHDPPTATQPFTVGQLGARELEGPVGGSIDRERVAEPHVRGVVRCQQGECTTRHETQAIDFRVPRLPVDPFDERLDSRQLISVGCPHGDLHEVREGPAKHVAMRRPAGGGEPTKMLPGCGVAPLCDPRAQRPCRQRGDHRLSAGGDGPVRVGIRLSDLADQRRQRCVERACHAPDERLVHGLRERCGLRPPDCGPPPIDPANRRRNPGPRGRWAAG